MVASASGDKTVKLWNLTANQEWGTLHKGESETIFPLAFAPDGKMLAAVSVGQSYGAQGKVRLSNPDTGKSEIYFPDNVQLQLWNLDTGKIAHTLPGVPQRNSPVALAPDNKTLALGGFDGEIRLWDVATRTLQDPLKGQNHYPIHSVAFTSDGKTLASGGGRDREPGEVRLWDVATRAVRTTLQEHKFPVVSLAFSRDGTMLASGSASGNQGELRLWDVDAGQKRLTFQGTQHSVTAVAFTPDGKTLASGTDASESRSGLTPNPVAVRLWDVSTGQERGTLREDMGPVKAIVFAPDGRTLAAVSDGDTTVRLWRAATDREVLEYTERLVKAHPNDRERKIDLVLACWGLYLNLDRKTAEGGDEARRRLEQGRTILIELQKQSPLTQEQEGWIEAFGSALKKLPAANQ